jgi:hypothetical protein
MQIGRYSKLSPHSGTDVHPWLETPDTDTILVLGRNDDFIERIVLDAPEVLFIDTRGISRTILDYIKPVDVKRTIYFNPADKEYPLAFNPMTGGDEDTVMHLLSSFQHLFDLTNAPLLSMVLRHSLRLTLEEVNPTLLSTFTKLLEQVERKKELDPYLELFWSITDKWDDKKRIDNTQSTLNKLDAFLFHTTTRNILSQKNKLVFKDNRVFVDLSAIPKELACLLGSLLMQQSSSRIVVTDAHWFKTPERQSVLMEHKGLPVLDYDTLVVFKTKGQDREAVAKELGVSPHELTTIQSGTAWVKTSQTTFVTSPQHQRKFYGKSQEIIDQTRRKYCTPRATVETDTARFIHSVASRAPASSGSWKKKKKRT